MPSVSVLEQVDAGPSFAGRRVTEGRDTRARRRFRERSVPIEPVAVVEPDRPREAP